MLDDALMRNHLAYTKALDAVMPLVKTLVETELQSRVIDKELTARERSTHARLRKWERAAILQKRIRSAIGGMLICGASRAARSLPGSIIGQIESYLELHETHATVGLPTVQPLRRDEVPYEQASQQACGRTAIGDVLLRKVLPDSFPSRRRNEGSSLINEHSQSLKSISSANPMAGWRPPCLRRRRGRAARRHGLAHLGEGFATETPSLSNSSAGPDDVSNNA
jgi:hypothetical protein